ncbi:biosynthetic peptidoglycan transglycosylase [Pseudomonadota bacterium]
MKLKSAFSVVLLLVFCVMLYYTSVVLDARKNTVSIVESAFSEYGHELYLSDLSAEQLDILLKVEDPGFYHHQGLDLASKGAGMTTITQALVKYLYFDDFKQGIAKIKQTLIAMYALDQLISKETQLELFLNSAYFGIQDGTEIRGFHRAAEHYYGTSFDDLSKDEYISLVAILIGPNRFNPMSGAEALADRVDRIKKMLADKCNIMGNSDVYYELCK